MSDRLILTDMEKDILARVLEVDSRDFAFPFYHDKYNKIDSIKSLKKDIELFWDNQLREQ